MLLEIAALTVVCAILAGGVYFIWKWGPGRITRRVSCPERHVGAKVTFIQKETGFGYLLIDDVARCSLLPDGAINCPKTCR